MKICDLLCTWEREARTEPAAKEYRLDLSLENAARLAALAAMYPGRDQQRLLGELVAAALDELERAMPYVPGGKVIAEDELGDPIYEDLGPTPRFYELKRRFEEELASSLN